MPTLNTFNLGPARVFFFLPLSTTSQSSPIMAFRLVMKDERAKGNVSLGTWMPVPISSRKAGGCLQEAALLSVAPASKASLPFHLPRGWPGTTSHVERGKGRRLARGDFPSGAPWRGGSPSPRLLA